MKEPSLVDPSSSIYVHPGEMAVSAAPRVITTILGSCVAVCLWSPGDHVGGLNHFLLPQRSSALDPLRFGDSATEHLIAELLSRGCRCSSLKAKLFGGAMVGAGGFGTARDVDPIGMRNVGAALSVLERHRIPIVVSDVGGTHGRRIIFMVDNGMHDARKL